MRIKKPEDEKYFKDIVLKEILDEISTETGAPKVLESSKKEPQKNRLLSKTLFFSIIVLIFFFFVLTLSRFLTDVIRPSQTIASMDTNTTVETEDWKMKEDRIPVQKSRRIKTIKVKPIVPQHIKSQYIQKKTDRIRAKEALLHQMQN